MSFFKEMQSRKIQKKANNFIKSLDSKSAKEVEQAYLDNKEFENNEIVLSYIFFNLLKPVKGILQITSSPCRPDAPPPVVSRAFRTPLQCVSQAYDERYPSCS